MLMRLQRVFPRYPTRLPLYYRVGSGAERHGMALDVSARGLYARTVVPVRCKGYLGSRVDLRVMLPDRTPVMLFGRLVWLRSSPRVVLRATHGGFGVEIEYAPEPWFVHCMGHERQRAFALPTLDEFALCSDEYLVGP